MEASANKNPPKDAAKTPPKPKGWCKQNGIEHSWTNAPMMPTADNPTQAMRMCVNCGQKQTLKLPPPPVAPVWEDVE